MSELKPIPVGPTGDIKAGENIAHFNMTTEEAASFLRLCAERTATLSKDWSNFEHICQQMLEQALAYGRRATRMDY